MRDYPLLTISFCLIFLMGFLHIIADKLYLYWTVFWFDNLMHFLGGLSLALFCIWIAHVSGLIGKRIPTNKQLLITALLSIFVIGIGWEIFEYANGLTQATEDTYALDVSHDLIADFVGAIVASFIARWKGFYTLRKTEWQN